MNDLTKTEHEVMSLVDSMQNFHERKMKKSVVQALYNNF